MGKLVLPCRPIPEEGSFNRACERHQCDVRGGDPTTWKGAYRRQQQPSLEPAQGSHMSPCNVTQYDCTAHPSDMLCNVTLWSDRQGDAATATKESTPKSGGGLLGLLGITQETVYVDE